MVVHSIGSSNNLSDDDQRRAGREVQAEVEQAREEVLWQAKRGRIGRRQSEKGLLRVGDGGQRLSGDCGQGRQDRGMEQHGAATATAAGGAASDFVVFEVRVVEKEGGEAQAEGRKLSAAAAATASATATTATVVHYLWHLHGKPGPRDCLAAVQEQKTALKVSSLTMFDLFVCANRKQVN